jgi:hypothetical protein
VSRQATGREQLFYTLSMEDHVPQDHLLPGIHLFLDLSAFRQQLEPFCSPVGRPSIELSFAKQIIPGSGQPIEVVAHYWDRP